MHPPLPHPPARSLGLRRPRRQVGCVVLVCARLTGPQTAHGPLFSQCRLLRSRRRHQQVLDSLLCSWYTLHGVCLTGDMLAAVQSSLRLPRHLRMLVEMPARLPLPCRPVWRARRVRLLAVPVSACRCHSHSSLLSAVTSPAPSAVPRLQDPVVPGARQVAAVVVGLSCSFFCVLRAAQLLRRGHQCLPRVSTQESPSASCYLSADRHCNVQPRPRRFPRPSRRRRVWLRWHSVRSGHCVCDLMIVC